MDKRLDTERPQYLVLYWMYPQEGEAANSGLHRHFREYDEKVSRDLALQERLSTLLRAADRYAYTLWKHCLFCRDCLWRERTSIYSWRSPCFAGDALPCLTGDHSVASLAITVDVTISGVLGIPLVNLIGL